MNEITLPELNEKALSVQEKAKQVVINDKASLDAAGAFLLAIKGVQKQIDETFDPIIAAAFRTHKEAVARKKDVERPLLEAEAMVKPKISAYINAEQQKRRDEEQRLTEEARKKAADEQLRMAISLADNGRKAESEAVLNAPTFVPPLILPKEDLKVAGISTRKVWKFRLVDQNLVPREYLMLDVVKVGAVIRALKDQARIPGIEVYAEENVAASSFRG